MKSSMSGRGLNVLQAVLWLWIAGVLAVYLMQFQAFIAPILSIFGL